MSAWERRLYALPMWALFVLGTYWASDREFPVRQISNQVIAAVHPGDEALTEHHVYRDRLCWAQAERYIFDGVNKRTTLADEDHRRSGALGDATYRLGIQIPRDATPGSAHIVFVITWRCNPAHFLWPLVLRIDMPFVILPP